MNAINSSVFMYSVKRFYCFIRMFFQTYLFKKVNIKCLHGNLLNGTCFLKNLKSFAIFAELILQVKISKLANFIEFVFGFHTLEINLAEFACVCKFHDFTNILCIISLRVHSQGLDNFWQLKAL